MPKRKRHSTIEIDKLTNSIEEAATGKSVASHVGRVLPEDKLIRAKDWRFDWQKELGQPGHEVYALTAKPHYGVPQGLISIEDKGDHIYMHLLESALQPRQGQALPWCTTQPGRPRLSAFLSARLWWSGIFRSQDEAAATLYRHARCRGASRRPALHQLHSRDRTR